MLYFTALLVVTVVILVTVIIFNNHDNNKEDNVLQDHVLFIEDTTNIDFRAKEHAALKELWGVNSSTTLQLAAPIPIQCEVVLNTQSRLGVLCMTNQNVVLEMSVKVGLCKKIGTCMSSAGTHLTMCSTDYAYLVTKGGPSMPLSVVVAQLFHGPNATTKVISSLTKEDLNVTGINVVPEDLKVSFKTQVEVNTTSKQRGRHQEHTWCAQQSFATPHPVSLHNNINRVVLVGSSETTRLAPHLHRILGSQVSIVDIQSCALGDCGCTNLTSKLKKAKIDIRPTDHVSVTCGLHEPFQSKAEAQADYNILLSDLESLTSHWSFRTTNSVNMYKVKKMDYQPDTARAMIYRNNIRVAAWREAALEVFPKSRVFDVYELTKDAYQESKDHVHFPAYVYATIAEHFAEFLAEAK